MKVPLSWLREFVEITDSPEVVAERLTAAGMKVEKLRRTGVGVEGIVVAEVLEVSPHPNADKLSVVRVRNGCLEASVVCGASNYRVGDRVPLAGPGSKVAGMTIQARKFRGVYSEGMLCSARELGLGDDHSGIMILGPEAVVGADASAVLGLGDVVFELEINPNRPDAMGMLGIAREASACTGAALKDTSTMLEFPAAGEPASAQVSVAIHDPKLCPRYLARVIDGVKGVPAPGWAQRRLAMAGVRPISAVVDATNYAMLVTAHPLHAFDLTKVSGRRIVVRLAEPGEQLVSIDGATRVLQASDLVIADDSTPVALAGVMGGLHSEISGSTSRVILESASFDPSSIFRTSRRLGLRSEASARFERGVDAEGVALASELATALICAWTGATARPGCVDVYPEPEPRLVVSLRPERARALLGADLPDEQMLDALARLRLDPVLQAGTIRTTVPPCRMDLRVEEDLVEEVARVVGYDKISARLPTGQRAGRLSGQEKAIRRIKRALNGAGLFEARTSSLVGPAELVSLGLDPAQAARVANPITQDESLLRTSIVPGLMRSASLNFSRRPGDVRLFEVGKTFHPRGPGQPEEKLRLAMFLGGTVPQNWHSVARELDFFDLSGALEVILTTLRIDNVHFEARPSAPFHPLRAAAMVGPAGEYLGMIGELDCEVSDRAGVPARSCVGEIDLESLIALAGEPNAAEHHARYPAALLDIAIVLPEQVESGAVLATARFAGGELLESIRLLDVYRGEQVGEQSKSLAFALTFRSPERTLNDGEALAARDAIAKAVFEAHGGRVRE
ncbi:MAG: phenylalanine--tRNA ligase subunit beta [Actinomycetota bacterium]